MKEEIKNLKMGSGIGVCSEGSTVWVLVLQAPLPDRRGLLPVFIEIFMPRMEFKGCITDHTRRGLRGVTIDEVMVMIVDLWTWRR